MSTNNSTNWTKVLVTGILGFIILCLSLMVFAGFIYSKTAEKAQQKTEVVQSTPETIPTQVVEIIPTQEIVAKTDADEPICSYRSEMLDLENPDAGMTLLKETEVTGPAILQLNGTEIVVIYPNEKYTAPSGKVLWTYEGDLECLMAQVQFFPGKKITEIK